MSVDFQNKIQTIRNLNNALTGNIDKINLTVVETILKNANTLMAVESNCFGDDNAVNVVQFLELTNQLVRVVSYIGDNKESFETGNIRDNYIKTLNNYMALYERLNPNNDNAQFDNTLYELINETRRPKPLEPLVDELLNAQDRQDIDLPEVNPLVAEQVEMMTTMARLKLWVTDTAFPKTSQSAKEFSEIFSSDNPLWSKTLQIIHNLWRAVVSVVEDVVRGAVKVAFWIAEKAVSILDSIINLFTSKDNNFKVLQKSVHAVGQGVDDALGQTFSAIKDPHMAIKSIFDLIMSAKGYISKLIQQAKDESIGSALLQPFKDIGHKIALAYEYAKENPYEALRYASCLATHIVAMTLLIKYVPAAVKPTPAISNVAIAEVDMSAAFSLPSASPSLAAPAMSHAPVVASGNIISDVLAVQNGMAIIAPPKRDAPPSRNTQVSRLFNIIKLLNIVDNDDKKLYQTCADELIVLKSQRFKAHVNNEITRLDTLLGLLDPEDLDNQKLYLQTTNELSAYQALKDKIQPPMPRVSSNPYALCSIKVVQQDTIGEKASLKSVSL